MMATLALLLVQQQPADTARGRPVAESGQAMVSPPSSAGSRTRAWVRKVLVSPKGSR